jgi:hypothetical protein
MAGDLLRIGQLAEMTETSTDSIRHYERLDCCRRPPGRTEGGYRLFPQAALRACNSLVQRGTLKHRPAIECRVALSRFLRLHLRVQPDEGHSRPISQGCLVLLQRVMVPAPQPLPETVPELVPGSSKNWASRANNGQVAGLTK